MRSGLEELGYVEGRNLVFDYRSADGNAAHYPNLVAYVIGRNPDLIIARGTPAALAVKRATSTTPVVMIVGEPLLVVDSLARPGGNITGLSGVQPALEAKRMELQQRADGVIEQLRLISALTHGWVVALDGADCGGGKCLFVTLLIAAWQTRLRKTSRTAARDKLADS